MLMWLYRTTVFDVIPIPLSVLGELQREWGKNLVIKYPFLKNINGEKTNYKLLKSFD